MKITIVLPAYALDANDEYIDDASLLNSLDGQPCGSDDECMADHLDMTLSDIGVIGGVIRCEYSEASGLRLACNYWSPRMLAENELNALAEDTIGQLSDGIGESGFTIECAGGTVTILYESDVSAPLGFV